jgi:hypothetical protein
MKLFYLFFYKTVEWKNVEEIGPPKINHLDAEMVGGEEEERSLNYRLASFDLNWILFCLWFFGSSHTVKNDQFSSKFESKFQLFGGIASRTREPKEILV